VAGNGVVDTSHAKYNKFVREVKVRDVMDDHHVLLARYFVS